MNFKNKIKDATFKEIFIFILIIIFFFLCVFHLSTILKLLNKLLQVIQPFLIGGCIAFVFNIPMNFFIKRLPNKLKNKEIYAGIITLFLFIIIIFLIIKIIVPQIIDNIIVLVNHFDSYKETTILLMKELFIHIGLSNEIINLILQSIGNFSNQIVNVLNSLLPLIFNTISSIASSLTNLIFSILIAIYLVLSKDKNIKQWNRISKVFLNEKRYQFIKEYLKLINDTFTRFISSQVVEAFIIGVLCYIGCLILGIQYASIVSVIIGITNVIPVFGAIIGTFISTCLIAFTNPLQGLIFLIFGISLQQIESNLIYPHVVGSSVGLPPLWVLFAVSVGGGLFGIAGMLFGLPTFSIIYEIVKRNYLEKEKRMNKS